MIALPAFPGHFASLVAAHTAAPVEIPIGKPSIFDSSLFEKKEETVPGRAPDIEAAMRLHTFGVLDQSVSEATRRRKKLAYRNFLIEFGIRIELRIS